MKLTQLKIAKAKQTRFGRLLCRMFGDERGAVMMEYVVLGVLVVAAAVAMVLVFGNQIRDSFKHMITAMQGKQSTLSSEVSQDNQTITTAAGNAESTGQAVAGGEVVQ